MLTKAYIPYKGYYSTPFARWQGSMANAHAIHLAAETSNRWFSENPALLSNTIWDFETASK